MVIRSHDPLQVWRARVLLATAWLGSSLVVAALVAVYVARASHGGSEAQRIVEQARENELRARIAVLERSEQVARAGIADVQKTLRERDEEVDGLRADLAFYARLVGGSKTEGLSVHALRMVPVQDSQAWNFTVTLTQNARRGQGVNGHVTLSVEGIVDGKLKTLDWGELAQGAGNTDGIVYDFKYFQQVSGTIMLPVGFTANRAIVRTDGDAGRVEQEFSWKDALKAEESDDVRK